MAIPKITGSGPNSRTNLKNIHSGERSFQKDLSTTHSQISLMQQALTSLGYNTKGTDGIFGDNTASAVKFFQRACNLTADGYFGKIVCLISKNCWGITSTLMLTAAATQEAVALATVVLATTVLATTQTLRFKSATP